MQLNIIKAFVDKWKSYISAKNVLLLTPRVQFYPKDEQGKSLTTSFDSMFAMANSFRAENRRFDSIEFFSAFAAVDFEGAQVEGFSRDIDKDSKYDLIIGDLPFGMNQIDFEFRGEKIKIPRNWGELLQSLLFLKDDGTALYLIEPLGFSTAAGQKFEKLLNKNGFYVNALFNAPDGAAVSPAPRKGAQG